MSACFRILCTIVGGFAGLAGITLGQTTGAMAPAARQSLVEEYCVECHNDTVKSGGFSWTSIDLAHPERAAEQSEKVIHMLRAGMMPPPGAGRPDAALLKSFYASVAVDIDHAAAAHPYVGRPALHRLNRTEYANSVRDLLGVEIDAASLLPADVQSHGFDNMADVLTTSPALLDAYVRAAGKISRQAVGDLEVSPYVTTYMLSKEVSQSRHVEGAPMGTRGGLSVIHNFPVDGEYVFKLSFYYSVDGPLYGKIQGRGQQIEISINGARAALFDIDPRRNKWDDMKTPPIKVKAGPQRVSAAFLQKFEGPIEDVVMEPAETLVDLNEADMAGLTSLAHLHDLAISGPVSVSGRGDTPSRRKIFTCRPQAERDEIPCAQKIISGLARLAYRRPVTDTDLEELMGMYQSGRNQSDFDSGIRMAIQAILANPQFVFRLERPPAQTAAGAYRIGDLELASRLSYFLWSSGPDDELLTLASQGKLRNSGVLEGQVKRMLADSRAQALSTNFATQWLHLQNLRDVQPDAYQFFLYSKNLADSMLRETQLFFGSIVSEDRNILDLLTADYTFVDELLARHYGIPNVTGHNFRRVPVAEQNRRGLLGQASILTLTSVSNRTSPVARGKYVMEVLLGTPPPAPPPNVPPLKDNAVSGDARILSVRERMEEHRSKEPCASCHKLMDPIGFALENFDAVGAWRINDAGARLDVSGEMFDGTRLNGPASLRGAIVNRSDAFIAAFTENLLTYGLGRVTDYRDMPAVRSIASEAAKSGNRFSSFVLSVVNSAPFQMSIAEQSTALPPDTAKARVH
jgi:Protein of unknown function (DUF1592)/Protein of unknown function (DUF1588)/Protein of unknown function (DUF1587)/Protein of unknown function (DUF1595)/Protein of unknown function (DUF1585)